MMARELYPLMLNEETFMTHVDDDELTMSPDLLQVAKDEVQALSETVGTMVSAGTLNELAPSMIWKGSISPQARLENGIITQESIDTVQSRLGKHYVPVTEGAPLRCGDGRILAEYDSDDAELYGRSLGPELFGATYGLALSDRITLTGLEEPEAEENTVVDDIEVTNDATIKAGFSSGAHTDIRNCYGGGKCGCGQIDGEESQFNQLSDSHQVEGTRQLSKARLGERYNQEHFSIAMSGALKLRSEKEQYLVPAHEILNAIREDNPGSVEILSAPHNEAFLIINSVEGTTLHRDEVAAETDGEIEAFGSDDWALWDYAAERYPTDKITQSIFVHAFMIKDGVTLPGLIAEDGSVKVMVRQPAAQAA